jgi:hypothetical protein
MHALVVSPCPYEPALQDNSSILPSLLAKQIYRCAATSFAVLGQLPARCLRSHDLQAPRPGPGAPFPRNWRERQVINARWMSWAWGEPVALAGQHSGQSKPTAAAHDLCGPVCRLSSRELHCGNAMRDGAGRQNGFP